MNKYLLIKFENAGLFYNNIAKQNDFIINTKNDPINTKIVEKRKLKEEDKNDMNIIKKHLVYNLLHTFINKRPVPHNRYVNYKMDQNIINMCKDDIYVKHNLLETNLFTDKNIIYCNEIKKINKCHYNSTSNTILPRWGMIKDYLHFKKDKYEKLIEILKSNFNIDNKIPMVDINRYFTNNTDKMILLKNECIKNKINMSIYNYVIGKRFDLLVVKNGFGFKIHNSSASVHKFKIGDILFKSNYFRFDGHIIVKVNDKFIDEFKKYGKYYTNFMDGGIAKIQSLKFENLLNKSNYIKL